MSTETVQQALAAAAAAQRRGDLNAAVEGYEAVLTIDPENPYALNSLGLHFMNLGDLPQSAQLFRRAAAADSTEPALWMNLAKVQRLQGDADGEATSLAAALDIDQRHFMARVRRAELFERQGQKGLALSDWTAALQLAEGFDRSDAALVPVLEHATAYVRARGAEFETAIMDAVKAPLETASDEVKRRFGALVGSATGKRKIYRNECAGMFYPFLPADEFFGRHHFPWLPDLESQSERIAAELGNLLDGGGDGFAPYVSLPHGTPVNKWSGLSDSNRWDACYLVKYGEGNAAIAERCPATMSALEKIGRFDLAGRGPTAFFSLLRPKTRIPPHTGVSNTRAIVHLPLIVPDGCGFRVGGETRKWCFGEAFAFDDTIEHEAWNDSDKLRAILIFDVWNPYMTLDEQALVQSFYEAADASGLGPPPVHDV